MQQTICGKVFKIQNTIYISLFFLFWKAVIVKIFVFALNYNPQITNAHIFYKIYKFFYHIIKKLSMLVGISETIRLLICQNFLKFNNNLFNSQSVNQNIGIKLLGEEEKFNQWLAGLIDGDGCFQLSKKGYASLEIVLETRDKHCLYQIKQKFGGSVKLRSGINWLRYRLHHKKGLLDLINAINGEIRNPIRLLQLNKIGEKYQIEIKTPKSLTYNNGWLAGFIDSDGSIYFNKQSDQIFISATQKNKMMLDVLSELYGGSVYIDKESFKWVVYRKQEIVILLEYFKLNPCRSAKKARINLLNKFLELRKFKAHLATPNSILGKAWTDWLKKWENYED